MGFALVACPLSVWVDQQVASASGVDAEAPVVSEQPVDDQVGVVLAPRPLVLERVVIDVVTDQG